MHGGVNRMHFTMNQTLHDSEIHLSNIALFCHSQQGEALNEKFDSGPGESAAG